MTQTDNEGLILEIQRMSTEDGPGIRTTVFFKGCTLKCSWCHNPESISPKPQTHWIGSRCIGCKTCIATCKKGALTFTEKGIRIDRAICEGCGECAEACPSTAMELIGKIWSLEKLVAEVRKDRAYFEKSGGGITVSGGEPTMQWRFASNLLKALREKGIHTALDTCGMSAWEALESCLAHADMVLFDLKEIDPEKHREFSGAANEKILENVIRVRDHMRSRLKRGEIWIRTPLVPGATANEENIAGIARFISKNLAGSIARWDLCSFNNLCKDKYQRLGLEWQFSNAELLDEELVERLVSVARRELKEPGIVRWSGATRIEIEGKTGSAARLVKTC